MKVTPQMMTKFEKCKSAEDVLELAKQENISLTLEQAKNAFALLHSEDIPDDVMEKVSGGDIWGNCPEQGCYSHG